MYTQIDVFFSHVKKILLKLIPTNVRHVDYDFCLIVFETFCSSFNSVYRALLFQNTKSKETKRMMKHAAKQASLTIVLYEVSR